jgi:2-polyprenyl-3-methyl-5-hydroxy-6-metoxy-1,4-benzoquinol methylase
MTCKICHSQSSPVMILENRNEINHLYRCPKCKIAFVYPQPSMNVLDDYYNGMYKELTVKFDNEKMYWANRSIEGYFKRLGLKKSSLKGKSFVDFGGGLGYYSKAALNFGLNSILVEKDPVSVDFAKNKLELTNIIQKNLHEFINESSIKYDFVFFRHVIEHVTDPADIIRGISSLLKKDGILIIETDNNAGIEILFQKGTKRFYRDLYDNSYKNITFASLLRKRPFALDPPRHLFAFRMANLSSLITSCNFDIIKTNHYRLGHPIYWPNIPSPNFKTVIKLALKFKVRTATNVFFDCCNLYFRILLQHLGLSSGICIYARKNI